MCHILIELQAIQISNNFIKINYNHKPWLTALSLMQLAAANRGCRSETRMCHIIITIIIRAAHMKKCRTSRAKICNSENGCNGRSKLLAQITEKQSLCALKALCQLQEKSLPRPSMFSFSIAISLVVVLLLLLLLLLPSCCFCCRITLLCNRNQCKYCKHRLCVLHKNCRQANKRERVNTEWCLYMTDQTLAIRCNRWTRNVRAHKY